MRLRGGVLGHRQRPRVPPPSTLRRRWPPSSPLRANLLVTRLPLSASFISSCLLSISSIVFPDMRAASSRSALALANSFRTSSSVPLDNMRCVGVVGTRDNDKDVDGGGVAIVAGGGEKG
jgi:hypothetical protein